MINYFTMHSKYSQYSGETWNIESWYHTGHQLNMNLQKHCSKEDVGSKIVIIKFV